MMVRYTRRFLRFGLWIIAAALCALALSCGGGGSKGGGSRVNIPAVVTLPTAVTLSSPSGITASSVTLSWSKNNDTDFVSYKVFYGLSSGANNIYAVTITNQNTVSYTVAGLAASSTYYFKVKVTDSEGATTWSTNEVTASTTYQPSQAPAAATLGAPAYITSSSMKLTWTQNNNSDFLKYKVLYSLTSGGALTTLTEITTKSVAAFYATGLTPLTEYYFKVYVYDTEGLYAGSNEVNATTLAPAAPTAVTLSAPAYITSSSMKLTWTQNNDSDFSSYKVFYSLTSGGALTRIAQITDKSTAAVYATGLTSSKKYYFKVYVYDTEGLYAGSNEVNATTLAPAAPTAVTLSAPAYIALSSMKLTWTQNNDSDFSYYKVFYSLTSGGALTRIAQITDKSTTAVYATGLTSSTKYYFKVYVYDTEGLYAGSNEVNATTLNVAPNAVTLSAPAYITSSSMKLSWSQNNDSDFSYYKVFYSLTSGGALTRIAQITDKSTAAVYATGLTSSTKYYFKVYVYDTGGLYAASNEVSGTTSAMLPKTFGGTSNDYGLSVQQTTDSGYIVAGDTFSYGAGNEDMWLLKLNASGNEVWNKTYGGTGYDSARSVQQTTDGGYIVAGTYAYGSDHDFWILKLDSSGNTLWDRKFGGIYTDDAYSIKQTIDGGYIVVGNTTYNDYWDVMAIKLNSSGSTIWSKTYGGTRDDMASSVQQTTDGGYVVAGFYSFGSDQDFWVLKLDSSGNTLWDRKFGGVYADDASSIKQTIDGGYIVAGTTESYGAGDNDMWILKLDDQGNKVWDKIFGGTNFDCANDIQLTTDGGYIVVGNTGSYGAGEYDAWILKLDALGNKVWDKTFGGTSHDYSYSVQQTADDGYIVAGFTESYGAGWTDIWVLKLNSYGNREW